MQDIFVMVCSRCGKTYEWPSKQFMRYLRNHAVADLDKYLCKECVTSVRMQTHAESKTVLYQRWKAMFARTRGQGHPNNVKYYLNKGITVCADWYDYKNFAHWAKTNGFSPELVIDRIDGNKGYFPENCHWVTSQENNNNRADRAKYG
jgi:hypothetical protein